MMWYCCKDRHKVQWNRRGDPARIHTYTVNSSFVKVLALETPDLNVALQAGYQLRSSARLLPSCWPPFPNVTYSLLDFVLLSLNCLSGDSPRTVTFGGNCLPLLHLLSVDFQCHFLPATLSYFQETAAGSIPKKPISVNVSDPNSCSS